MYDRSFVVNMPGNQSAAVLPIELSLPRKETSYMVEAWRSTFSIDTWGSQSDAPILLLDGDIPLAQAQLDIAPTFRMVPALLAIPSFGWARVRYPNPTGQITVFVPENLSLGGNNIFLVQFRVYEVAD